MRHNHTKHKTVADAIENAFLAIDTEAGIARKRYITDAPGQDAVYLEKCKQAKAYIENNSIDQSLYGYILAEADAIGATTISLAISVLAKASAWENVSMLIEARRIGAKHSITNLGSPTIQDVAGVAYQAIQDLKSM